MFCHRLSPTTGVMFSRLKSGRRSHWKTSPLDSFSPPFVVHLVQYRSYFIAREGKGGKVFCAPFRLLISFFLNWLENCSSAKQRWDGERRKIISKDVTRKIHEADDGHGRQDAAEKNSLGQSSFVVSIFWSSSHPRLSRASSSRAISDSPFY